MDIIYNSLHPINSDYSRALVICLVLLAQSTILNESVKYVIDISLGIDPMQHLFVVLVMVSVLLLGKLALPWARRLSLQFKIISVNGRLLKAFYRI